MVPARDEDRGQGEALVRVGEVPRRANRKDECSILYTGLVTVEIARGEESHQQPRAVLPA